MIRKPITAAPLLLACSLGFSASEQVTIHGGFVADHSEWKEGYFVTVSSIDKVAVEDPYIMQKKQVVHTSPGKHRLLLQCTFNVEKEVSLGGEKVIEVDLAPGATYFLSAKVNYRSQRAVDPFFRYCEPQLSQPQANNSFKADSQPLRGRERP